MEILQDSSILPISIHYCWETPFKQQLHCVSNQCVWTNSKLELHDWYPGPVTFGWSGLREQFYAPGKQQIDKDDKDIV